jgi:hypothetical protein
MGWLRNLWERLRGGKPAPVEQEDRPPTPAVEPESKPPAPKPLAPDEEAQERESQERESQELRGDVRARDHEKFEGGEKPPPEYEEN